MTNFKDYLQDPEDQVSRLGEISSEPVEANTSRQAREECEKLAKKYGLKLEDVQKRDKKWFDCHFRGE